MPAETYANLQASEADLVAFFAQGGDMDPSPNISSGVLNQAQ
jgi:hypothetical protein